jgi:hypothetical protein
MAPPESKDLPHQLTYKSVDSGVLSAARGVVPPRILVETPKVRLKL